MPLRPGHAPHRRRKSMATPASYYRTNVARLAEWRGCAEEDPTRPELERGWPNWSLRSQAANLRPMTARPMPSGVGEKLNFVMQAKKQAREGMSDGARHPRWPDQLLDDAVVSERALRQFVRLNPDVDWGRSAEVLRVRMSLGHPRRRTERQRRVELVLGTSVPRDYLEIVMRGRQSAVIRKDNLGQSYVATVRRVGRILNRDPDWSSLRSRGRRAA